ncbi:hypothetical protein ACJIZ3_015279 [Penstemon smallii]|uniref:RING-type domain-containing protein n=1 Tax=Penstemon smallii TaxID=265156 RepID=A0ABD3RQ35_9LAMI
MAIQAQLCNSENLGFALENACGFNNFSFVHQQQQQQQLMQFDQFQNSSVHKKQRFLQDNSNSSYEQQSSMAFYQSISDQIEKQTMEIDRFITLQNERLRLALQEQRKQQTTLFLNKYEAKTQFLLKQKEDEIAKATNRKQELEQYLKRIESEIQKWQRVAKENESMVESLNSTIERLKETALLSGNGADDAESCCENKEERIENYIMRQSTRKNNKMICKCCNVRGSCVIMLPCRHLSSCKDCEAFLDSCPVCRMVKKGSIEALI